MSSSTTNLVHPTVALLDQVSLDLHHIYPQLQKLLKSVTPRAGAQKVFDGVKEPLERVAKLYTAGQQNQDWHSATIFRFYSSVALLAHVTKVSGHSWMLPSVEAERLAKDPKRNVINFKSDDCSQLTIESELVEKVCKMEQQSRRTQPTAADDLGLSLSEADDGDDLLQDLGFEASPLEHSPSPEPTTGPSSSKPLTAHLFPKPPSTKPTVPDESAESEVEVEPSVKRQKGKGKAKADPTTVESEDGDDDDDADGSLDEEVKAPPPASKTTKAPAKVPDSKAKDPKAPTTSTSGTRTHSGQHGGKPVSTSGANLPRGRKHAVEEEVKAGPSSKRTKVATKEK